MTRKSWRDIYPVHPAADVFPMMTEEELRDLGKDIKKNGLRQPVVLWREVMGYRNLAFVNLHWPHCDRFIWPHPANGISPGAEYPDGFLWGPGSRGLVH